MKFNNTIYRECNVHMFDYIDQIIDKRLGAQNIGSTIDNRRPFIIIDCYQSVNVSVNLKCFYKHFKFEVANLFTLPISQKELYVLTQDLNKRANKIVNTIKEAQISVDVMELYESLAKEG